jgi:hypothetical protein
VSRYGEIFRRARIYSRIPARVKPPPASLLPLRQAAHLWEVSSWAAILVLAGVIAVFAFGRWLNVFAEVPFPARDPREGRIDVSTGMMGLAHPNGELP